MSERVTDWGSTRSASERLSLVGDMTPRARGKVLMVRYRDSSRYDGQRGWFLPDDLLNHAEHPAAGAGRILREQLGWSEGELRRSQIESFGRDDGSARHLVFHYLLERRAPSVQAETSRP